MGALLAHSERVSRFNREIVQILLQEADASLIQDCQGSIAVFLKRANSLRCDDEAKGPESANSGRIII